MYYIKIGNSYYCKNEKSKTVHRRAMATKFFTLSEALKIRSALEASGYQATVIKPAKFSTIEQGSAVDVYPEEEVDPMQT